jgi:O-antigen/teichoic acid export membrane protein
MNQQQPETAGEKAHAADASPRVVSCPVAESVERSVRRVLALNAASRYLERGVSTLTQFLLTPFLIHAIGKPHMGLATLAGQALQFVSLASSAIDVSYTKFCTDHYARREFKQMNEILSGGLLLSLLSALLYAAGTSVAALFADRLFGLPAESLPAARWVFFITGLAATLHMSYAVWMTPVFATQRLYLESFASILSYLGASATVWLLFQVAEPSIVAWVAISSGYRLAMEVLFVIPRCRHAVPQMRIRPTFAVPWKQLRTLMQFSGFSLLAGLGYLLYYATDSILICNLSELGEEHIVDYNVAQRWDPQIRLIVMAFVSVLTPMMTADAAVGNRDRLQRTFLRGMRYSMVLGLYPCLTLGILAGPFLRAWLGPSFSEVSVPVMHAIMGGFAIALPGLIGYEAIFSCGRIGKAAAVAALGGVLNLVLSVLLVKVAGLGLLGVGLGSMVTVIGVNGMYLPAAACRQTGVPIWQALRQAYLPSVVAAAPTAALAFTFLRFTPPDAGLVFVLAEFAACGVVHVTAAWFMAFTREERGDALGMARHWFRRLLGR